MTEINKYQESINRQQTFDFLLGKKEYLFPDRERAGIHDMSITYHYIREYGKIVGSEKLLTRLKEDIEMALKKNLIPFNLSQIIGFIYLYQRDYRDKLFDKEWVVEDEIKSLIREKVNLFELQFGNEDLEIDYTKKENSNSYFLNNCKRILNMMSSDFDITI